MATFDRLPGGRRRVDITAMFGYPPADPIEKKVPPSSVSCRVIGWRFPPGGARE